MTRTVVIVLLFSLVSSSSLHSQDCQNCKPRILMLFDNRVDIPRPYANKDSIFTYWDYFFIAGGVKDYVHYTDPSTGCLVKLDGAFFTKKDTVSSNLVFGMEHANVPPSGEVPGYADYVIYGVVAGQPTHVLALRIEASGSRELVKSAQVSFPDHFDPFEIGKAAAAQLSPIYTTILDFEKKKRDGGEPYAVQPRVEFTPKKPKIDVNETAAVDIFMYDCDGVPLKNRNLTLTAEAGTLNNGSVTTDDQGKASVQFTAGSQPGLGSVTTAYVFTHGNGYHDVADVQPASIQIKKPDKWYVTANFSVENTYTDDQTLASAVVSSYDNDRANIVFSAWVKNNSPVQNIFSGDPTTAEIVYSAKHQEHMHYRWHWEVPSAFIDENKYYVTYATSTKTTQPTLTMSISTRTYSFSIRNITASQTGGGNDVTVSCAPMDVPKTTTSVTNADPKTTLGLAASDANHDTTYTTTENSSAGGLSTKRITNVSQQFSWKNNICKLTYKQNYVETGHFETGFIDDTRWDQILTASLYMSYTGDPPTSVGKTRQDLPIGYVLEQNYPNPFNPTTEIAFALPRQTQTILTVLDVLGRTVDKLYDEEKAAGTYHVQWNASKLPSGVYFYRLQAGEFVETKKMIALR